MYYSERQKVVISRITYAVAVQQRNPVVRHSEENFSSLLTIRESVDSLCRDGADGQYMQYLSKSRITSPQTR